MDLFSGRKAERDKALAAAVFHWKTFAARYKGIPSRQLSFDLINEPPWVKPYEGYLFERYDEIVRALVAGIREADPDRLIVADGLNLGQTPVMEIADARGRPEHARLPAEGGQPLHGHLGADGGVRDLRGPHLAAQGQQGRRPGTGSGCGRC